MKFDATIHAGHVMQAILAIGALAGIWFALSTRVAVIEHSIVSAEKDRIEMRKELRVLADSVNRLAITQERLNTILDRKLGD